MRHTCVCLVALNFVNCFFGNASPGIIPCTVDRLPMTEPLPTPRNRPVVFYPPKKAELRNAAFKSLVGKEALSRRLGSETVKLTSSNAFSDGETEMLLRDYIEDLNMLSAGTCVNASETVYLFGGNYSPGWTALLDEYRLPPCHTCVGDNAAVSFGLGGEGSGVSWHVHGAGLSEVFHGRKRWFLLPPKGPVGMHDFNANLSVAQWVAQDLPGFDAHGAGLVECTLEPGEVLYFPSQWPHATLNLDSYTSFASTFLIEE